MKEYLLAILSVVSSIFIVCLLVGFGWYIVWKAFLSRFRFVRELLGGMSETSIPATEQKTERVRIKKSRRE